MKLFFKMMTKRKTFQVDDDHKFSTGAVLQNWIFAIVNVRTLRPALSKREKANFHHPEHPNFEGRNKDDQ
ncbi:hypothetical protein T4D_6875 [Trichinella pseudospiralis]|uniref:Uncharacterized protein n=1 Tax=Trichinella pseudospiralis TaxID=6337 RepID=A0A0V1F8N4_TRIPS|nr:hypothetical protein T4D_6875 [Trichinella pseudospiralis]